jgi:Effector Associated Constant Component 1
MTQEAADSFQIALEGSGADEATLYNLLEEVSAVRGASVSRTIAGPAPEGSKSLGIEALGLLVQAATGALPNLVGTIGEWLTRQPPGTRIRLKTGESELEWEGGTPPAEIMAILSGMAARAQG